MVMLKVIGYEGRPETFHGGAPDYHNPVCVEGTNRIVLSYTLLNHAVGEESRRGFQLVEQEAQVEGSSQSRYNTWKDRRYVNQESIDKLFSD